MLVQAAIAFALSFVAIPFFLAVLRFFGVYTIVHERECVVYVFFGKVVAVFDEPGLYFLPLTAIGWRAPIILIPGIGQRYSIDMRLDQEYLRSQPVNSEEGAPMGIGVWYEMFVSDPVAFLFRNADPRGSLASNVSSASIRCLSNMQLSHMLEDRHEMSRLVRNEVSSESQEWGYRVGSVYIRKVHFRDVQMIRQIEEKVVNRLRQVTSAIKQDGVNQVSVITSTAEKLAAVEFAKAAAVRPKVVGEALAEISKNKEVSESMFEILEAQKLIESHGELTVIPGGSGMLNSLLAAKEQ